MVFDTCPVILYTIIKQVRIERQSRFLFCVVEEDTMLHLKSDKIVYSFSDQNEPVMTVSPGATIWIETMDCFANQLRSPQDRLETLDWDQTNPATGPIYVQGAEPGDTLKVTIEKIELDEKGTAVCGEGMGTLGHLLKGSHTRIIEVSEGTARFAPGVELPLTPMIGVIGVAPQSGQSINTGTPGHHGGNMDDRLVTEGATLYFPVAAEGALFAMGDVHAVMGDGEIGVTGLEIPAKVTVVLEVIKEKAQAEPVLENEDHWSVIVSRESLDQAAAHATEAMFRFLKERVDLAEPDLTILMSLAGQLQFCQVVDPLKTVRFVMPKKYIGQLEF